MIKNMSLEKQENQENVEQNKDTLKLTEEISKNLNNPEDTKVAGKILDWFQTNPNLSNEENFKNAYNQKVDKMIADNFKTSPEKVIELQALKNQETEGKTPEELIKGFQELESSFGTIVAESNKRNSDIIAQNQQNNKTLENQKQNDFITEFKEALKQQLEEKQQKAQDLAKKENQEREDDGLPNLEDIPLSESPTESSEQKT